MLDNLLCVSESDITSNARLKNFPLMDMSVLQVANSAIFRKTGYEPRKRSYDVPPKGEATDPVRSKESSRNRAKAAVRDNVLCNLFTYFFTLTLSPDMVNRYDPVEVGRKLQTYLKNVSHRKGFQYVIVPELHKDGAIHFHGFCNLGSVRIVRAFSPYTNLPLSTDYGQPIYNIPDWKFGYSTCVPIDENYERACNYVLEYLSKGCDKILGKWYLSSRNLQKKPDICLIDGGMDYDSFVEENPSASVVPIHHDICMAILKCPAMQGGIS